MSRTPYQLQFELIPPLREEIKKLKEQVKTQQEAVNAATIIIDELRKENQLLKDNLFLQAMNNEIGRLKQQTTNITQAYITLYERYETLLSKYIRS